MSEMNVRLVGLAGLAGSGKDEAAQALITCGWQRRAFADKLRDFLVAVNPIVVAPKCEPMNWDDDACFGTPEPIRLADEVLSGGWDQAKRLIPEVRQLLQRVGTEAGRAVLGTDVWVNATLNDLPDSTKRPVVVTDVRFPNEVQAIRERGGIVVQIVRPGVTKLADDSGVVHPSESALDRVTFDHVIHNNSSVVNLHAAILNVAYNACASVATR